LRDLLHDDQRDADTDGGISGCDGIDGERDLRQGEHIARLDVLTVVLAVTGMAGVVYRKAASARIG